MQHCFVVRWRCSPIQRNGRRVQQFHGCHWREKGRWRPPWWRPPDGRWSAYARTALCVCLLVEVRLSLRLPLTALFCHSLSIAAPSMGMGGSPRGGPPGGMGGPPPPGTTHPPATHTSSHVSLTLSLHTDRGCCQRSLPIVIWLQACMDSRAMVARLRVTWVRCVALSIVCTSGHFGLMQRVLVRAFRWRPSPWLWVRSPAWPWIRRRASSGIRRRASCGIWWASSGIRPPRRLHGCSAAARYDTSLFDKPVHVRRCCVHPPDANSLVWTRACDGDAKA